MKLLLLDHSSQRDWVFTLPRAFASTRWLARQQRLVPCDEYDEMTIESALVVAHKPDFPEGQTEEFESFCRQWNLVTVVVSGAFQSERSRGRIYFRAWPVATDRDIDFRSCLANFLTNCGSGPPFPFADLEPPACGGKGALGRAVGWLGTERQEEILTKLGCSRSKLDDELEDLTGQVTLGSARSTLRELSAAVHSMSGRLNDIWGRLPERSEGAREADWERLTSAADEWVAGVDRRLDPVERLIKSKIDLSPQLKETLGGRLSRDLEEALEDQIHPRLEQAVRIIKLRLARARKCVHSGEGSDAIEELRGLEAFVFQVVASLWKGGQVWPQ